MMEVNLLNFMTKFLKNISIGEIWEYAKLNKLPT